MFPVGDTKYNNRRFLLRETGVFFLSSSLFLYLVPREGLEPSSLAAIDFESIAVAISPPRHD